MKAPRSTRALLPLLIAATLATGSALASAPAQPPTAQQQAAREEIERLTQRIEELSQQLGDDGQIRVIVRRVGPDRPAGDAPPPPHHGPGVAPAARHEFRRHDREDDFHGMRPGIGIVLAPNPAASGVRIAAVTPDSPATKGGLRSGDILLSVDGKAIAGSGDAAVGEARRLLSGLKQDQLLKLGYARAGKTAVASVKAGQIRGALMMERSPEGPPPRWHGERDGRFDLPEQVQMEIERIGPMGDCGKDRHRRDCHYPALIEAFRWQGLNLAALDAGLGRYFGSSDGVLVLSSSDGLKGLQSGDVIQRVGGSAVKSPRDVMRALRDKDEGTQLRLEVLRDRKPVAVSVTVPKSRPLPFMAPPPPPPAAAAAPPAPPAPPAAPAARTPGVAPVAPALPPPPPPPARPSAYLFESEDGAIVRIVTERGDVAGDADEVQEIEVLAVPSR